MRELIERFSYRFQLWLRERYGDYAPADPTARNPLRYVAAVAMFGVILDIAQPFLFHRAPRVLEVAAVPASLLFLIPYLRSSKWAWYVCVGWLMFAFLAYWTLYFAGYTPYQLRLGQPSVFIVLIPDIILTAALLGWFVWVRDRYFRFLQDASSTQT